MLRKFLFLLVFFGVAVSGFAQESRGAISGRVTDSSGSVLPGAQIHILNTATEAGLDTRSNDTGLFTVPFLLPGAYDITVDLAGFKKLERRGIEVRVNDNVNLDLQMDIGDSSQRVEVTASTPLLETANTSLGQVVDRRRMTELPIASGNAAELVLLAPGTTNATNLRSRKAAFNNGPSQVVSNGNAQYSNEFTIDGVPNTFASGTSPRVAFSPPQTVISEFKVLTTFYDAAIGHTPGSVVNLVTSSGTNQLHGEVHEFFSNSALDAPDLFTNRAGNKKVVYQDNRYGGSIGGPVRIPKVYDGRNKTFFFYGYEGNKWGVPGSTVATVPTAAEKSGDFSQLLALGPQYQIYDPATTTNLGNGHYGRQPFAGNIIPATRIDPVASAIAQYWASPNSAGRADGTNNYTRSVKAKEDYYTHFVRVDHNVSENHRLFFRLDYDWWQEDKSDLYDNLSTGVILHRINRGLAFDDVYVLSPTTVFNFRYGITEQDFPEQRRSRGFDLASLGFSPSLIGLTDPSLATFPRVQFSPFSGFGDWETGDGTNTGLVHSFNGNFTTLARSHSLHYGIDFRVYRAFQVRFPYDISPSLSFDSTYTRGPFDNSAPASIGQELTSFLLGIPSTSSQMQQTASYADQELYYGLFLQDDWKVSRKLTLNLGLRVEHETPVTERFNRAIQGFDYTAVNPIEAQATANYAKNPIPELPLSNFQVLGGLQFAGGQSGRELWRGQSIELLPRIGLAYQLDTKTVIRTGYGIFYDTLGTNRSPAIQTGFTATTPVTPTYDNGVTFVANTANPFPNGLQTPLGAAGGLTTNLGRNLTVYPLNRVLPYAQRWSFGVQRELRGGFLLDASYVGNHGIRLSVDRELNYTDPRYLSTSPTRDQQAISYLSQQFPNPFYGLDSVYSQTISRANLLKPYPEFGSIQETEPNGYSWYHSLQAQVVKRFSHGYTLNVAYTFSKIIEATSYLNPSDPMPWRGIGTFDRPHRIVVSGIWELPVGRGRSFASHAPGWVDAAIGGWQLNAVVSHQSGAPLNWGNIIFNGDIKDITLPGDQRAVDHWFNTDAGFVRSSSAQLASNIRTFPLRFSGIRGDGQSLWNLSAVKYFPLTERIRLQFRAECYNALNHPNLNDPNVSVTSGAFGTVSGQDGSPRQFQLAAKINF